MVNVLELINELEQFDNKHGYRMSYEQVSHQLFPIVELIVKKGEELLPYLHELIKYEETWSCLFALMALKDIKNPQSVPYLIDFLKRTNDSDYYKSGEEAMFALTEIKDERVYSYMVFILEDYTNNPEKYNEWFSIDAWCFDFTEQGNKEVLPLLKRVLDMPNLTDDEQIEIKDTIEALEDPEKWQRKIETDIQILKKKIGRNEPCPFGSGKKYKKCCLN